MSAPHVAVVVPVYNAGRYLTPCLDAIAAQTLPDFVCVLVDDGSTDGSGAVCDARSAADPRFLTLHQKNAGVSAARAAGVRCALAQGAAWLVAESGWTDADGAPQTDRALYTAADESVTVWLPDGSGCCTAQTVPLRFA